MGGNAKCNSLLAPARGPSIISGPGTNAASYMNGGRAADLIKADV